MQQEQWKRPYHLVCQQQWSRLPVLYWPTHATCSSVLTRCGCMHAVMNIIQISHVQTVQQ
jgi:hypothetical protein